MKNKFYIALVWLLVLSGCASVPMAPQNLDAEAKTFVPDTGKANIYVSRGTDVNSCLVAHHVYVSKGRRGLLATRTYLLFSVSPGPTTIQIVPGIRGEPVFSKQIVAEAGSNYFFHVSDRIGFAGHQIGYKELEESQGREQLLKYKRAQPEPF